MSRTSRAAQRDANLVAWEERVKSRDLGSLFPSTHLFVLLGRAQRRLLKSQRSEWLHCVHGSLRPSPLWTPPLKTHCSQDKEKQMETGSPPL